MVITRFLIGWATVCSAGLLTYPVASRMCPCLSSNLGQYSPSRFVFRCLRVFVSIFYKQRIANIKQFHITENKSIVHVCPACDRPLATRMGQINDNGFTSYTKVHKYYSANNAGGKGGGGHTATSFQASGYSIVHVGNQNYFMPAAVEGLK